MSTPAREGRHLVLVVGVGRSGTSLLTGILGQLGFQVPQPEVEADPTNPRGFSEPRWVVDFHQRLLRKRRVTVNDSRPAAFAQTASAADDPAAVAELRAWLAGQFATSDAVVVKDPRTSWFLPLWRACADELGVSVSFVTMVRHPTEVVASALRSYGDWQSEASRTTAWINVSLETERATRGARRAFIRYDDLLADWRRELERVEAGLVPLVSAATPEQVAAVDAFVDPSLHRNRASWEGREVTPRVRDLAEAVWMRMLVLTGPDADGADAQAALDELRATYGALYAEAEAIAQSSIVAARGRGKKKKAPRPTMYVRLARKVPVRYRRRLRRAVASLTRRG